MTKLNRPHGIEVGSVVRVISDEGDKAFEGKVGQTFVVRGVEIMGRDGGFDLIYVEGVDGCMWPERFSLESQPVKRDIQVGDKIVCVDTSGCFYPLTVGKVYEALELTGKFIYVNGDDGERVGLYLRRFELYEEPAAIVASVVNGVDAAGKPLNFTKDNLKPFMRVAFAENVSGGKGIVTMNAEGEMAVACKKQGWVSASFDAADRAAPWNIVEVYAAPDHWEALDQDAKGPLLWKAMDVAKIIAIADAEALLKKAQEALATAQAM